MKIEKVNENQIRCTLTKQDLADRQINCGNWHMVLRKQKDFSMI